MVHAVLYIFIVYTYIVLYVYVEWYYTLHIVFVCSDGLLAHNFKQTTGNRFSIHICEVCQKGFSGFMKHALKCVGECPAV